MNTGMNLHAAPPHRSSLLVLLVQWSSPR